MGIGQGDGPGKATYFFPAVSPGATGEDGLAQSACPSMLFTSIVGFFADNYDELSAPFPTH